MLVASNALVLKHGLAWTHSTCHNIIIFISYINVSKLIHYVSVEQTVIILILFT
jgi:hypothetical protein